MKQNWARSAPIKFLIVMLVSIAISAPAVAAGSRSGSTIVQDKLGKLGPLMDEIGQELVGIAGGNPDGIFLYVEIGKKWISSHLYKREGKLVRELDIPDAYLAKLIRKAWRLEPNKPNMRWSVMNYGIKKGKFDVLLKYPEEVDVEAYDQNDQRRSSALKSFYGSNRVIHLGPRADSI